MSDDNKMEKTSGYLEKKGKLKVMCSWKKYWFVLEGRLLLYYRSKDEYDAISPCKGSINLGPPCSLKSCPSVPGVFQIETRNNTVTLRSENRAEQNRWMQAIMQALNQHTSPAKLTHFRYSLDSLVPPANSGKEKCKEKKLLERQNTMPDRLKTTHPKKKKQIIQRLQKLGAHTYGGSLGTINKLAQKQEKSSSETHSDDESDKEAEEIEDRVIEIIPKQDNPPSPSTKQSSTSSIAKEESPGASKSVMDKTAASNENLASSCDAEKTFRPTMTSVFSCPEEGCPKSENQLCPNGRHRSFSLEEKGKSEYYIIQNDLYSKEEENHYSLIENDQYQTNEECGLRHNCGEFMKKETTLSVLNNIYERISSESGQSGDSDRYFMVDNENYSIPQKKSPLTPNNNQDEEILIDNEQYISRDKRKSLQRQNATISSDEAIYSEPKLDPGDQNRNSIMSINSEYATVNENVHVDYPRIFSDDVPESEHKYEKVDRYSIDTDTYCKPVFEEIAEKSNSPCPHENKTKAKHKYNIRDLIRRTSSEEKCKSDTKKCKSEHKCKDIPKKNCKEEKCRKAGRVKKSSSFIRYVWKRKIKKSREEEEEIYEEVDKKVENSEEDKEDVDNAVQMLCELHNILESKKTQLKEKLLSKPESPTPVESIVLNINEKEENAGEAPQFDNIGNLEDSSNSTLVPGDPSPELPKKTHCTKNVSPYHDVPTNNQPIIPPKTSQKHAEKQQSLNEILDDLDKEEPTKLPKNQVKKLIEKFDDVDKDKDEVVLRKIKRPEVNVSVYRHSDELDLLLNELTKVTIAPIMTPGVTSSLVNPKLTDEEWLRLLPIRKRRMSEPDYDVPRSHRSLLSLKNDGGKELTGTRFFGPVLKACDTNDATDNSSQSSVCSMTPDSLEPIDDSEKMNLKLPEPHDISYTSHTYLHIHHRNIEEALIKPSMKELKCRAYNYRKTKSEECGDPCMRTKAECIENVIYAQPKNLKSRCIPKKSCDSQNNNLLHTEDVLNKKPDVFVDSLEQCTEISTAF